MRIFNSKKRVALLSLASVVALGVCAVEAGAIGTDVPVRGSGTLCLTPDAARTLAAQHVTMEAIAPATTTGTCVTLPGTGTLSPSLTGGTIPYQGGIRFSSTDHRLDITKPVTHISLGEGNTTADFSQDGAPAATTEFVRFPVSLNRVSFTPTSVDTKDIPLTLTNASTTAFTNAFGASPTAPGAPLFTFDGHGEITNPLTTPRLP